MKTVVITGSTKGIGLGLAEQFIKRGHRVVVSGRNRERIEQEVHRLASVYGKEHVSGTVCDVTDPEQVRLLWEFAVTAALGRNGTSEVTHESPGPHDVPPKNGPSATVDIWINCAGLSHPVQNIIDLEPHVIRGVINTNVTGLLLCCSIAGKKMREQGHGFIYNFEGFGSTGQNRPGVSVYGASKRTVNYINKSLKKELRGTGVKVGALYPGMVVTDLLIGDMDNMEPGEREQFRKIINILADPVEPVTEFLADRMLKNQKSGTRISWLTTGKAVTKFLLASFRKRDLV